MSRKDEIRKARRRRRHQKSDLAQSRYMACGRKVPYSTREEAEAVANQMGHSVYPCGYGEHFHTAHLPGARRFTRDEMREMRARQQ